MKKSNLKFILACGGLGATVFAMLRLVQDGVGGEAIGLGMVQTAAILFGFAAVIHALDHNGNGNGKPPPRDG